ncbi:hypothetical protein KL918_005365 [Ogataea parapolymorpha]|uniref:Protein SIP3 n=1 Tax=Ogataea parapolymorpha (strain ATCC 26012 / BCRC 20466 / JCM 22074 / NRRL Y-7560 / DL-1) TaxID=871575 RepID=W1QD36_OGAPD|nr:Protein SIP3 [Ogataea parapolymorpha DL-1]ESW99369.1 Protein SIP3 [Ogataea parapolymorpha DL-1]KAG7864627.1 hypothetical protein KL918_005365 [Ogataea parapolymorpha]KAG7868504.1 hypothetical protein KL916_005280 [Ogataea parapolymorpha]
MASNGERKDPHLAPGVLGSTDVAFHHSEDRVVKLIAVGLKEASTDSPSFRASVNYMNSEIRSYHLLIKKTIDYLKRFVAACTVLQSVSSEFQTIFTSIGQNSLVNRDIAKTCIERTSQDMNEVLGFINGALAFKKEPIQNLLNLDGDFAAYFELRHAFEGIQAKYDSYLDKFVAQPKTLDPTTAREDAQQLFELRKQYIHISLSIWISITKLKHKVSSVLVEVCDTLRNSSEQSRNLAEFLALEESSKKIERAKYFMDLQARSHKSLIKDLLSARRTSEESVINICTPSNDLDSYIPATINMAHLTDTDVEQYEKHGWVFLKSKRINSKEIVWIKRWLFIKGDLFGFLSISTSGTYVEESDKIGILLANVRYKPEEDRKFCFEIKTLQTEVTIQVETLGELKSWLSVFHTVKNSALQRNSTISMSRYEPMLDLFALEPVVEKDLELVNLPSTKPENAQMLLNKSLPSLKVDVDFSAPLVTELTNLACLSHLYLTSPKVPSAFTANVWGFVNWGLYYAIKNRNDTLEIATKMHSSTLNSINLRYPASYPIELRQLDLQLRSLFESYIDTDEFVLVAFRAFWSANSKQELFCHLYVTESHIYVYTTNCGLVSISLFKLTNFLYVDSVQKASYDLLRFYTVSGVSTKMKLCLEPGNLVKDQVNYLISLKKSSVRKPLEMIMDELTKIKQVHSKPKPKGLSSVPLAVPQNSEGEKPIVTIASSADMDTNMKLNYNEDMHLIWIQKYDLPAKALFHVLVGDQSFLLQSMLPFAQLSVDTGTQHTVWRCDSQQKLTRIIWSPTMELLSAEQRIESMLNNKYYNFTQSTPYLYLPFGSAGRLIIRFIIFNTDSRSSKLLVYYKVMRNRNILEIFSSFFFRQVILFKIDDLHKHLLAAIQNLANENRKIASAIKLYGPITKFDADELTEEEVRFDKDIKHIKMEFLLNLVLQKLNLEFDKLLHVAAKLLMNALFSTYKNFQLHWLLILSLSTSLIFNVYLSGKSTHAYWIEHNTEKYVNSLVQKPTLMKRMISISDVQDFAHNTSVQLSYNASESQCFLEFRKQAGVGEISLPTESKVQSRLVEFGLQRNELLTELGIVNAAERAYLASEWKRWVFAEHRNCELARTKYPQKYDEQLSRYCESAKAEMDHISHVLL